MKFQEVLTQLRDGKGYIFTRPGIAGRFYKAPYPSRASDTTRDSALSAITYWEGRSKASPTLMLYDFDEDDWSCVEADGPVPKA